MSARSIRTLVLAQRSVDVSAIEKMIAEDPGLVLTGLIDNEEDWPTRSGYEVDALVIACGGATQDILAILGEEAAERPSRPVVVVCDFAPNGFVRQAFDAGADDIVVAPGFKMYGPDVYFAIEKAMTRKSAAPTGDRGPGRIVCVLGPKGGTGKTLTASNLAIALAAEGKRVAAVDLDLQFGDLGLVLGLQPERSIFDLVSSGGTLDALKLEAFLTPHASGVRVLLAPSRPDHAAAITPEFLRELYSVMRQRFDYIVVDTPPGFTPEVIATIDLSAMVVLIGTLDLPSLKNAKLGAETLELMSYPPEQVRLLLNRADTSVGVSQGDCTSVIGRAPDVLVPSNRDIVRSVNAGEPIVQSGPRSDAAKAFKALARLVLESDADVKADRPSRRRFRVLARS